ncbi:nucleotidyltransferase domain-containing protein [Methylohalobius crimeensis]|uniref:nucleotidyltransferase domain-containing protein n=1 Tax=Methylohalobius crimeensis TaxID=244365 RepID=UPI0003B6FA10|nr:nucleotidyltransferase domain-containing protein [Methylohalobius crimeensis]
MRLTREQRQRIIQTISRLAGESAQVYLFGSRLDDQARGGDVDLLIETDVLPAFIDRARVQMELESRLGLPVDIVWKERDRAPTPFQAIARSGAARLEN